MVTLNDLYDTAEQEGIYVNSMDIDVLNGMYLNYDKLNAIFLNYDKFETSIDEKCTFAEELGHYYTGATYNLDDTYLLKTKAEYRAKKWLIKTLVPYSTLKKHIKQGITNIQELAEKFDVTDKVMKEALQIYF